MSSQVATTDLSRGGQKMPQVPRQNTIFMNTDGLGSKTIGKLGSYVLLINNITGPGLVVLPLAFQQSGWFVTTFLTVLLGLLAAVTCCMIAESMTCIPGNEHFQGRVEFTYLAKRFLSRKAFLAVLCLFILSLVTTNISSIVESGQVLDKALLAAGAACALELYPDPKFLCITDDNSDSGSDSVFGDKYVISVGFLAILVISIPLGYLNLDDNIVVQVVSFIGLVVICTAWVVFFGLEGIDASLCPSFASNSAAFGYVFFNYSFVITVPSWINEKRPDVTVSSLIWNTTFIGMLFFLLVGILGSMAQKYDGDADLLTVLTGKEKATWIRVLTFSFPLFALVTSIPVFSIIMRYNLLENRICGTSAANFWSVLMPWMLSLLVYGGNSINYILAWAGIVTVGPLNFVVPAWVYLVSSKRISGGGTVVPESGEIDAKYSQLHIVPEGDELIDEDCEVYGHERRLMGGGSKDDDYYDDNTTRRPPAKATSSSGSLSTPLMGEEEEKEPMNKDDYDDRHLLRDNNNAENRRGSINDSYDGALDQSASSNSSSHRKSSRMGNMQQQECFEALPGWRDSSIVYLSAFICGSTILMTIYAAISEMAKEAGSPLV
mmetsp:Transcript_34741/g.55878  ORF Transcript_34741/g.55878 Transcript_34741/m.55878 type:complete len:606 (-) Transcript_34741:301-2118(-)